MQHLQNLHSLFCVFQLMHVSDWLPTLYSAAGGDVTQIGCDLDGVDQWDSLVNNEKSLRYQLLININEREKTAALRIGDWKLVPGGCSIICILFVLGGCSIIAYSCSRWVFYHMHTLVLGGFSVTCILLFWMAVLSYAYFCSG